MVKIRAFICGCGHSGTTILARILGAHPEVFWPPFETGIFLADKQRAYRDYDSLCLQAAGQGKLAVVEKTPRHLYRLDLIRELVPGAKFLITVRDGRDVAASSIKRTGNADFGIERWLTDTRLSLRENGRTDVLLVRYEDLVSDPRAAIERICTFIGLRFDAAMLDYHKQPVMWQWQKEIRKGAGKDGREHAALRNWQINQPIFDGRGIWKDKLSSAQIARLETGPGRPLMRALGYLS